ncbi:hypothetical protein DFH94DRAFT_180016 [Russula ochroleuca]|uniref:F-box domain-containing protein n=1 Tax=Russula ochroleuca TaxID=152965 RepID=A0A9P5TDC5_9AGAM|nr:hypothetical protein DFH94DRAFT_180016 [Russula ochroleuca]
MAKNRPQTREKRTKRNRYRAMPIDVLPDDVLLAIFDFCVDPGKVLPFIYGEPIKERIEVWQPLVHVCRRWRSVVFGSPHRLNLRLVCTDKTPARNTLDVWPALPLLVFGYGYYPTESVDDIIVVLKRSDHVCRINFRDVPSWHLEKVSAAMQEPFPELTELLVWTNDETVTVLPLPDSFLGGAAPRLRRLWLSGIPFPGLPKVLLSASHLVTIHLWSIPHSGYITPEAMVTALSTLTSLGSLILDFESPLSRPDWESRCPPPQTRIVLPALTYFEFKGANEYLDDLVSRVDAPRANSLSITFFNDIVFDTPQFTQFISRTPMLKALMKARVTFEVGTARELDWQVSSLEQVCASCLPPLTTMEDLYIYERPFWQPHWQDNIENSLWLELLHPFADVKNLYLSEEVTRRIVPALQELVGGRTTELLPTLQNVFLEGLESSGPVHEGIGQFVSGRQVTGHTIAVSRWYNSKLGKI